MWERFMADLREEHLGAPPPDRSRTGGKSVRQILQAGYEEVVESRRDEAKAFPQP
jgi:hypothetical protein